MDKLEIMQLRQSVIRQEIGGYDVPTVNAPLFLIEGFLEELAENEPFSACWWDCPEGRIFSLLAVEGGINVAKIAEQYGGRGYPKASVFIVQRTDPLWIGARVAAGFTEKRK